MRFKTTGDEAEGEIPITPLIDCVFLLIIFFLVTSMFKRFEMLIPIAMPDQTSALSQKANDEAIHLAIDPGGHVSQATREPFEGDILVKYHLVGDFAAYLKTVADGASVEVPLEFSVERGTPTQTVINVLDIAQLQGFVNVSVKTLPEVH